MDADNRMPLLVGIVGLLLIAAGFAGIVLEPTSTVYEYEVKGEQVSPTETDIDTGAAPSYTELSPSKQEALFKAFKQTDHFLGGASAHIDTTEPINATGADQWQVVEVEGVYILVGFYETGTHQKGEASLLYGVTSLLSVFAGILLTVVGLGARE